MLNHKFGQITYVRYRSVSYGLIYALDEKVVISPSAELGGDFNINASGILKSMPR